ncbi:MAG: rod shape-determining protein RodA [Candidatus Buchananbacteria bacterium]|nr:rod shape-determining protein RodA [Candidatus Buchananbacteria bacterium]
MLPIQNLSIFKKIDWSLFITVLFLSMFGLAAIYSVALGQGLGEFLNFKKQIMWLVLGVISMFVFSNVDYHYWQRISWIGYFISLMFLVLVLTPLGSTIRGTQGWFSLGFFSFQPVELAKIFLIVVLANVYCHCSRTINQFRHLFLIGLIAFIPFILAVSQPDFGSAMVLFFTWFISFFLVTKNKWHIIFILISLIALFILAWFFIFADYQKDRINTFVNPSLDPLGSGYNVRQSIIAVGAGRLVGRGLGFGSQSQLKFIPESQTDFIFSVIAEELGFVGVVMILGFFLFLFYRFYKIALMAPDDFGMFLSILVAILIFIHVFINIGMGVGLLPVTGISLPFISYGGSFVIVMLTLVGIVMNVYKSGLISRKNGFDF